MLRDFTFIGVTFRVRTASLPTRCVLANPDRDCVILVPARPH
jgi:hypothetical protein